MNSLQQISEGMFFDNRLSLSDLRVYFSLIKIAAGSNECTVSKKTISRISNVSKVERHTKNLRRYGFLKIKQHKQGDFNTYEMPHVTPMLEPTLKNCLSSFMKEFVQYSSGVHSRNTTRTYLSCLRELVAYVGDVSLKSIDVRILEQFLSYKKTTVSAHTARRHYISLKSIFERAVVWGLIDCNPFKKIRLPKVPEAEVAYLTLQDLKQILSLIKSQDFRDLILAAFYTSMRRGELLALRWRDIDLAQGLVHVRNSEILTTKNGRNRSIGICNALHEILSRREKTAGSNTDWVFTNGKGEALNGNWVTKEFKKYIRKAGLDSRLRWHSLRHSGASLMLAMGAPSFAVQRHLGHRRLQTTEIYLHASQSLLQQTVNTLPPIESYSL